ncbi:hypothetical protein EV178_004029 [Coemansia sp. RSA 1646]|nr:hypothetical protein EV178_004029 [Coemansia sp. RSA 1646]KAJ2092624.1 hypothetical protein IW138_001062 [Coemansia sp. RSA 986]
MADPQQHRGYRTVAPVDSLPFELVLAICARLRCCSCATPETQAFALGCSGNHPPGAFGSTELSALRQTSRRWRTAALRQGLAQLVVSNRWMRNSTHDRLRDISRRYAPCVRKIVFRSSDFYQGGPRRSASGSPADEFDAVLAIGWPCLDSVSVEMFSVRYSDHETVAAAVRRNAPSVRELYIRDKLASFTQIAPLFWGPSGSVGDGYCASIRRLAIKPYGYNQHWSALMPNERGAAEMLCRRPNQLTSLAIGGSDFTPELLCALQNSQQSLKYLSIEHAWIDPFVSAPVCLPSVTSLHLEHVAVDRSDAVLPLVSQMFPNLCTLSVRHVWQRSRNGNNNVAADSARGAVTLQNNRWLEVFLANEWPCLRSLTLPAIADMDAERLPAACPSLVQLVTNSLDYSGPRLSALGLVNIIRGLKCLRHLSIEQRKGDGSPGYEIMDAAMCRLIGTDDEDMLFTDRMLRRTSTASSTITPVESPTLGPQHRVAAAAAIPGSSPSLELDSDTTDVDSDGEGCLPGPHNAATSNSRHQHPPPISRSLSTLYIPRASFTTSTLDSLVQQLPNLVKLSASLRSDSLFGFGQHEQPSLAVQKSRENRSLKWIGISADEDILTDPQWLSAWLIQRFPKLEECSTNHARSHKRMIAELREAAPAVKFTRMDSRALQTTYN